MKFPAHIDPAAARATPVFASANNCPTRNRLKPANCNSVSRFAKPVNRSQWKTCLGMSECPSTGIDKAILKFAPQGRKNLKMYRSHIQDYFVILFGIFYRFARQLDAFRGFLAFSGHLVASFMQCLTGRFGCHSGA
ncbi:hypothetical protein [Paraburkholderia rhynchosiae]|uniref:hypothetical protein n=1 Tax=Paraburkholderia rhynchosiae TaxID=487049 RepID=UPI0011AFA8BB|nr:hypothetical protein [Paraburkholderia rhynchosiae]